jgi:hypothetical protein
MFKQHKFEKNHGQGVQIFISTCGGIPLSFIYKNVCFYIINKIMHFYHGHCSYLWLYCVQVVMCVINMKFLGMSLYNKSFSILMTSKTYTSSNAHNIFLTTTPL